jgi:proteasome lid subunit RPN8/RPN11
LERGLTLIEETVLKAVKSEGEKSYPYECCGILFGKLNADGGKVLTHSAVAVNSGKEGELHHRFLIEPEDIIKAELFASANGLDVLGIYHSHPDHPAEPSEYDREYALPFYFYLIVSVRAGTAENITGWELADDRTHFIKRY